MAHAPVSHGGGHGGGHDGSRSSPRGGPSTDALLVIPCCGIANRVRVVLGAVLVGAHANRRVTVGWSKERTLNSSFGALWQPSSFNVEDVEHACGGVNAHDLARLAAAVHAPSWDIPRRAGITCGAYEGPYRPGDVLQGPCVIRGCIMPPTLGPQHAESLFNRAGLATIATIRNATQAIHEARQAARRHASATGATWVKGNNTDVLYAGATLSTVWDAALCRPWVLDALRAHFTPVASIVELVRAGLPTANHSVLGVHLRDQDRTALAEQRTGFSDSKRGAPSSTAPGRRLREGEQGCAVAANFAKAVLIEAADNPAIDAVYVASSSDRLLADFQKLFEAGVPFLPRVNGRRRSLRLLTVADLLASRAGSATTLAHGRNRPEAINAAVVDLWALASTATLFRGSDSSFGELAAVVNNEQTRSFVVRSMSCGSPHRVWVDSSAMTDLSFCTRNMRVGDVIACEHKCVRMVCPAGWTTAPRHDAEADGGCKCACAPVWDLDRGSSKAL